MTIHHCIRKHSLMIAGVFFITCWRLFLSTTLHALPGLLQLVMYCVHWSTNKGLFLFLINHWICLSWQFQHPDKIITKHQKRTSGLTFFEEFFKESRVMRMLPLHHIANYLQQCKSATAGWLTVWVCGTGDGWVLSTIFVSVVVCKYCCL